MWLTVVIDRVSTVFFGASLVSTTSRPIPVVVDTNVLLHFKQPDQMDWAAVADDVVLLIIPVVVRELEKIKAVGGNLRVRQRAGKVAAWLARLLEAEQDVQLRPGVALRFIWHDANIDFEIHRLVREIQDDHVIASMIDLAGTLPEKPVLCTADVGLRMKAKPRGIALYTPPESERLAEDADPKDRQITELRRELQQLSSKLPQLNVRAKGGESFVASRPVYVPSSPISVEELRGLHPALVPPKQVSAPQSFVGMLQSLNVPGEAAVARYNEQREDFFARHERHQSAFEAWSNSMQWVFLLELELQNVGTSPAMDIDVALTVPEGIDIVPWSTVRRMPQAPIAPPVPINAFGSFVGDISVIEQTGEKPVPHDFAQAWDVVCKANRARFKLVKLKHGLNCPFPLLAIKFMDREIRSFSFQVHLSANELACATEHELQLVISR